MHMHTYEAWHAHDGTHALLEENMQKQSALQPLPLFNGQEGWHMTIVLPKPAQLLRNRGVLLQSLR
jgi:hypothetical protein